MTDIKEGLIVLHIGTRSAVLILSEGGSDYNCDPYSIYINGERRLDTNRTVTTVYNLTPDVCYRVSAVRGDKIIDEIEIKTLYEFVTLDVRDFGAKGDGVTDDTLSIQAAILTCPKNSRVLVPKGKFRFRCLFIKNDITIEITDGAVLSAIPDKTRMPVLPGRIESYDETSEYLPATWEGSPQDSYCSLITGIGAENVVICGGGTIDGCADFDTWWNPKYRGSIGRPRMIFLNHCKNITITGITIKNSPSWNIHPYFSENMRFYDLKIESPAHSHNTDGLNPESCKGVDIAGVYFSVGDDCIAIKSGKMYMGKTYKTPSRDIWIHHCLMEKGHGGVTIGSEVAAGVDNIKIENCRFVNTDRGLRVKTRRGRGEDSYINGIVFDSVKMQGVMAAFVINSFYYCGPDGKSEYVATKEKLPVDDRTPRIGEIIMRNVVCTDCNAAGVYFYGLPESPIESVVMENVEISFSENARQGRAAMMLGCEPTSRLGIFIRNADRVNMRGVTVKGFAGSETDIQNVGVFTRE